MRTLILAGTGLLLVALLAGCGGNSELPGTPDGGGTGAGNLSVQSTPSGAAIKLDGHDAGRSTPYSLDVDVDPNSSIGSEYVVTLTRTGYNSWSGLATVSEGETFTVEAGLSPATAGRGSIQAASVPSGARIILDGTDTGRSTPATLESLPVSQHVIEYRLTGFHPFREEVGVEVNRVMRSSPTLTRLNFGRVTGRVLDAEQHGLVGAQVLVRGAGITTTTTQFGVFTLPNVPVGTRTLDAAATAGGSPFAGTRTGVTVKDGLTTANIDIVTSEGGASGRIEGRVTDSRGGSIGGALLFASQAVGSDFLPDSAVAPREAQADQDGSYAFDALPEGFWVVTAVSPDFATVTQGMGPQILVTDGRTVTVDFTLPPTTTPRPGVPRFPEATAFTMPAAASRAPGAYNAIIDRLRAARKQTGAVRRSARRSRSAPNGSLIEIDLAWEIPGDLDIVGYFIGRSTQQGSGFGRIEDLLSPNAGFWVDYDSRLSAGQSYYYRIAAVNSRGLESDPSAVADAQPLGQVASLLPGGAGASATPTFSWEALPGGFSYQVQLFESFPDGSALPGWHADTSETSLRYPTTTPLQAGHTYYWVVVAGNSPILNNSSGVSISKITPFTVVQ